MNAEENVDQETTVVSLVMTREQRDVVENLFAHYDWEYREVNANGESELDNTADDIVLENDFHIDQDPNSEECPECLCRPCITHDTNRQLWWEDTGAEPHQRNSQLRKTQYGKFWTMLSHRGVWKDDQYIEKKEPVLEENAAKTEQV